MAQSTDPTGRTIQSVETALEILQYVHAVGGAGVTEIAEHVGLSKGTAHCHLNTLYENRYLVKEGGTYRIGLRFLGFGGKVSTSHRLYRFGKQEAIDLMDETGETVQLCVEQHGKGIYLFQSRGREAVRTDSYVGAERHLHATSFGKAILAHLPEDRVDAIVDRHGLPAVTENTITERAELADELAEIRDRGVAFDEGEQIEGMRCVAAPVLTPEDEVVGALSLTGPMTRMNGQRFREEIPERIRGTARVIEIKIENA